MQEINKKKKRISQSQEEKPLIWDLNEEGWCSYTIHGYRLSDKQKNKKNKREEEEEGFLGEQSWAGTFHEINQCSTPSHAFDDSSDSAAVIRYGEASYTLVNAANNMNHRRSSSGRRTVFTTGVFHSYTVSGFNAFKLCWTKQRQHVEEH